MVGAAVAAAPPAPGAAPAPVPAAVGAAPGAGDLLVAAGPSFQMVRRGGEWDEVLAVAACGGGRMVLVLTTDDHVTRWHWSVVQVVPGLVRATLVGGAGGRQAPVGVPAAEINWCCSLADNTQLAVFTGAELAGLQADGRAVSAALDARGGLDAVSFVPGTAGPIPVVALLGAPVAAPVGGAGVPPGLGGAIAGPLGGGVPAAAAAGAEGLGFPTVGAGGPTTPMDMSELSRLVMQMRDQLRHKDRSESSDKKEKKKKKKGRRHRSGSRRRRRGSSSSSSSDDRHGRHKSKKKKKRDSSSSSTSDYVRWKSEARSKRVDPKQIQNFATRKFRDQSDVVSFAAAHPGALAAAFLQQVHQKYSQLMMSNTKDLRKHNLVEWSGLHSNTPDKRDSKEMVTCCLAMDSINAGQLATAMDVLSQRIVAIQLARSSGGSWEKASRVELTIPGGGTAASAGLLRLSQ